MYTVESQGSSNTVWRAFSAAVLASKNKIERMEVDSLIDKNNNCRACYTIPD